MSVVRAGLELHIIGEQGQMVGRVILEPPLRLGVSDALDLMSKLAGGTQPAMRQPDVAEPPTPAPDSGADDAGMWRNLRSRAESYDLPGLYAWLRTLDPSNPHMQLAYDVVSERIRELEKGGHRTEGTHSESVNHLVERARTLEESYRADAALAEQGDDAARLRAQQTRSQLVQLQADIADGVDRSEEAP